MAYTQLTREQRYQIYILRKAGHPQNFIAREIGVHPSTISREVKRGSGWRGYRPKQADESACARKQNRYRPRINAEAWALVEQLLRQDWSPEQVSGWLLKEKRLQVSHERIYQYIYADKVGGGTLSKHLRCRKRRRKRYGSYDRRGQMPNCRSIEERPRIVDQRKRVGDWEADTIIGQNHQQAILSLVERKSKLCLLKKVERNTAAEVEQAIAELLLPVAAQVYTITSDNGREFANHQSVEKKLKAAFYFAHPFAAWERGTNENTNGLVRQYFPKGSDFSKITEADIQQVTARLNNRPRKRLNYRTPQRVFFKEQKIALTT
ncbi:MAG: IS30 family transposase [Thermoleophilaceae bacterium]|nr:IS30 family transposase [Thermoleophilaceae bacterium]